MPDFIAPILHYFSKTPPYSVISILALSVAAFAIYASFALCLKMLDMMGKLVGL